MKLPFQPDLTGKVAVVTGAAGVLMREFSRALCACGAKVALLDINQEAVSALQRELGENALGVPCNCLDEGSIAAAKRAVNAKFGAVNFLVNGAGGNRPGATTKEETATPSAVEEEGSFFDLPAEAIRQCFDLNVTSAFLVTQAFAKDMVGAGGNVINISSMNAFRPLTKIPAYSAAKAGVSNFTAWLAVHFAPCGVRCNAIAPGFFVTAQNKALLFDGEGNPTPRTEKILRGTPMNRFGVPSDLLGAFLFLASDEASGFVTGTVLPVDGGFAAYSGV